MVLLVFVCLSKRKHTIWVFTSSSIHVFTNDHLAENALLNPLQWGFKLLLHQKKKKKQTNPKTPVLRLLKFWVAKSGISFSKSCFNSSVLNNWTYLSFLSAFFSLPPELCTSSLHLPTFCFVLFSCHLFCLFFFFLATF